MKTTAMIIAAAAAAACAHQGTKAEAMELQRQLYMQPDQLAPGVRGGLRSMQARGLRELASAGVYAVHSCAGT